MTPKEKAKEIFDKMMYEICYNCQPSISELVSKHCSLLAVDEILHALEYKTTLNYTILCFYEEVKQEIEKL